MSRNLSKLGVTNYAENVSDDSVYFVKFHAPVTWSHRRAVSRSHLPSYLLYLLHLALTCLPTLQGHIPHVKTKTNENTKVILLVLCACRVLFGLGVAVLLSLF